MNTLMSLESLRVISANVGAVSDIFVISEHSFDDLNIKCWVFNNAWTINILADHLCDCNRTFLCFYGFVFVGFLALFCSPFEFVGPVPCQEGFPARHTWCCFVVSAPVPRVELSRGVHAFFSCSIFVLWEKFKICQLINRLFDTLVQS